MTHTHISTGAIFTILFLLFFSRNKTIKIALESACSNNDKVTPAQLSLVHGGAVNQAEPLLSQMSIVVPNLVTQSQMV